jgi:hypothetical protein
MIDVPWGWEYGFPKVWDVDRDPNLFEWLVQQGYPQEEIDRRGKNFFIRSWVVERDEVS